MSMRIYKGFGFIATPQFINLNSDIAYVRLENDDKQTVGLFHNLTFYIS